MADGHVDEHRTELEKASLTRSVNEDGETYTLLFVGGNGKPAVICIHENLRATAEQLAVLTRNTYLTMLEISAKCAGDSRLTLADVLSATGRLQNTVVEHLRIVSNPAAMVTFDFRVSTYHRLVTGVFREVHAVSFDDAGWYDFEEVDDLEGELPVVNAFFDLFTVPWGTPESVFGFCLRSMSGEVARRDRFVALRSFPGLTAAASKAFLDDVIKANMDGSLLHNFELHFPVSFNSLTFFRHPQLRETPNDASTRAIAFSDHSLLELRLSVNADTATLAIKYTRAGSSMA